jgi:hypothetical protein
VEELIGTNDLRINFSHHLRFHSGEQACRGGSFPFGQIIPIHNAARLYFCPKDGLSQTRVWPCALRADSADDSADKDKKVRFE